jgi:hypothetical protein
MLVKPSAQRDELARPSLGDGVDAAIDVHGGLRR